MEHLLQNPKKYFIWKTEKLKKHMKNSESKTSISTQLITGYLVKNKDCEFDFQSIQVNEGEKRLASLNNENPSELDKLETFEDGLQHYGLTYRSYLKSELPICPKAWKAAKLIPLPKNRKQPFRGANSLPISILPVLSKLMG